MSTEDSGTDELLDFLDEIDTIQCGEGGCGPCDDAFRCSTQVITPGMFKVQIEEPSMWELDTLPELPWNELGGEGG